MTDAAKIRGQRRADLVRAYRLFGAFGWGDAGDGHISVRDPERHDCFWLLGGGTPFHRAALGDLVLVGPDGELLEGQGPWNRSAYHIHHPIHAAREDVICAAHTHTPWGTPFSAEVRPIEPITQEACLFFEDCAVFDDEEVQVQDCAGGERIAQALGKRAAVILRNHGLLTVADSVTEAVGRFVMLERVAEAHLKARQAIPISAGAARYAKQDLVRQNTGHHAFESLVARHVVEQTGEGS